MSPESILDVLGEVGVLEPADADAEEIVFSVDFIDACEEWSETLAGSADLPSHLRDSLTEDVAKQLDALADGNLEFLTYYLALADLAPADRPYHELVRLVLSIYQLRDAPSGSELTPKHFINVGGDWLDVYVKSSERAVVYVWREECPECDIVREDLDDIFDGPSEELGLYAVYGPPYAKELHETFNIVGAPTVLFVMDGKVDARLHGPHQKSVLEREINYLLKAA